MRTLRIEEHISPRQSGESRSSKLRLKGRWLERAGFHPGAPVSVASPSPGVLEIRLSGPVQLSAESFTAFTSALSKLDAALRPAA